jgi:hypothetical protein
MLPQPPETPPVDPQAAPAEPPPLTASGRIIRGLLAGTVLTIAVFVMWMIVQFSIAATLSGTDAEAVGLTAIVTGPIAGVLAGIAGLIIGALSRKGKLRWGVFWTLAVFLVLSPLWAWYMVVES